MPVEIKELHIKVTVNTQQQSKTSESPGKSAGGSEPGAGREEIVAECVEKVLEIIRNKKER